MKRVLVLAAAAGLAVAGVLIEEDMGLLTVGDRAPEFSAVLSTGQTISLADYRGKQPLVLFFYPKDETAGCTAEVCSYRDNYAEIQRLGAAVVGVSFDPPESHERFIARHALPFPLVADTSRRLGLLYGVTRWRGPWPVMKRVTYVIDRNGVIRGVFHHELLIARHVERVISLLAGL